jgi:hypothetical protein
VHERVVEPDGRSAPKATYFFLGGVPIAKLTGA